MSSYLLHETVPNVENLTEELRASFYRNFNFFQWRILLLHFSQTSHSNIKLKLKLLRIVFSFDTRIKCNWNWNRSHALISALHRDENNIVTSRGIDCIFSINTIRSIWKWRVIIISFQIRWYILQNIDHFYGFSHTSGCYSSSTLHLSLVQQNTTVCLRIENEMCYL